MTKPEELFTTSDPISLKKEYRVLALKYHPDHNKEKEATEIFEHINSLHEVALKKIANGCWEGAGKLFLDTTTLSHDMVYYRMHPVGFVKAYIADKFVLYVIPGKYSRFYDHARTMMLKAVIPIPNNKRLTDAFTKFLPDRVQYLEFKNGDKGILIPKQNDTYTLRDILNYYGGSLDPRHVAWILSSLYNMNCYLKYQDIVHYDLSLESYFISPKDHSGFLLGGWWYAFGYGAKISEVPKKTFEIVPHLCKTPSNLICRELIRSIGRELLGDPKGINLVKETPEPLLKWVRGVSTAKNAVEEYKDWDACLLKSFGVKKFFKMDVSEDNIKGV